MGTADVADVLARHLTGSSVTDAAQLTGGASRETWAVRIDGERRIAQRQRAGAGAGRSMAVEATVLRAAAEAGVPVPRTIAFIDDADGDVIVSTHHDGETIPRRILRDDRFATARGTLVGELGAAAARIHATPLDDLGQVPAGDVLAESRRVLDEIGHPHPTFELALRWLDEHRPPPPSRPVLVHGDLRLGNVIVGDEGLIAVIDWELAHRGDPMEDLGWLCVPAWRFGSELPAAGLGSRDELFAAYEAAGGCRVDPASVRWWEICGIFRWGVMCMMQAEAYRSGLVGSHELAAIGRRVCENEHDLFCALDGRW